MKRVIVFLFVLTSVVSKSQPKEVPALNPDSIRIYMLELVNEHRRKHGVHELTYDPRLTYAAEMHAKYLAYGYEDGKTFWISHEQTDKKNPYYIGKYIDDRHPNISGENIVCSSVRKFTAKGDGKGNITYTFTTNREVAMLHFECWLKSPGHNKNMLNERWYTFSYAYHAHSANPRWYFMPAVQVFSPVKLK